MEEFERLAKDIAREAGDVMVRYFKMGVAPTYKEDHTPVTEADSLINTLVIERISAAYPEHSLLGEEGNKLADSPYTWVFDPIDGTLNFLRGVPINVFSLALVKDGVPVVGVVYDPYQNRLYSAVRGKGAYMNDARISTAASCKALPHSLIECDGLRGFKNLTFIETLRNEGARFVSYGSTVYAHMLVASGQIDGVIFPLEHPWDSAAAQIIVEEAGGKTSDIRGQSQRYDSKVNGIISAGNADLHETLIHLIAGSLP